MQFEHQLHRSRLMDSLSALDRFHQEDDFIELSAKDKEHFQDVFAAAQAYQQQLAPLAARIDQYYLSYEGTSLAQTLYLELLTLGHDPKTMSELYDLLNHLPKGLARTCFLKMCGLEPTNSDQDLVKWLTDNDMTPDLKWRLFEGYHHLEQVIAEMVKLYQEVLPIYTPYQEQFWQEVVAFSQELNVPALYADKAPQLLDLMEQSGKESCQVFVRTSLHLTLALKGSLGKEHPLYFFLHPRSLVFFSDKPRLDTEKTTLLLKILGDKLRYEMLLRLSNQAIKGRDLAKQLGTTPANLSFHLQKLVNSQLLELTPQAFEEPYQLNKPLLRSLMQKLTEDFGL